MPQPESTFDLVYHILFSVLWTVQVVGSYLVMAAAIFAGGWLVWRFVNDVLFP